jgi:Leucine-rich repeat (LRR) protein
MVGLRKLELGHNQLLDSGFVTGMENLRLLNLAFNRLVNIKGVETLLNLNALIVSENGQLFDVSPAKNLPALTYLSIKKTSAKWDGGSSPFVNVSK